MEGRAALHIVGQNIRQARSARNMKQNDLAVACDMEKTSISRIEAGKTNVAILTLIKIANALQLSAADLLAGNS